MLNNFRDVISRVIELKNGVTTKEFSRKLGMTQQTVDLYLKGERKPSLEFIYNICCSFNVSADWLLGLPERGGPPPVTAGAGAAVSIGSGSATASGPGAVAAGGNAKVTTGGDCSKCKLMQAHIREITGRG